MKSGVYTAAAGMISNLERLNAQSNNIANVNTIGFKGDIPFETVIRSLRGLGNPGDEQPLLAGTVLKPNQGTITQSDRKLDLAIEGHGFFVFQAENGEKLLSRNGSLIINANDEITSSTGQPVLDIFDKPVRVFGNNLAISSSGDVSIEDNYLTRLKVVAAPWENLEKVGNQFFRITRGAGAVIENPTLAVGALERANVEIIDEMAQMIYTQRSFEVQQRAIETILMQILRSTVNDLPRAI